METVAVIAAAPRAAKVPPATATYAEGEFNTMNCKTSSIASLSTRFLLALAALAASGSFAATLENQYLKVTGGGKDEYKIYRKSAATPFATFPGYANDATLKAELQDGSRFVRFKVQPNSSKEERRLSKVNFQAIRLSPEELGDAFGLRTMGTAGLQSVVPGRSDGSVMYMAVAKPKTRRGVVAGWLTAYKAYGRIATRISEGALYLMPDLDYGNCLVRAGDNVIPETFVVGIFDDCRLGLEAYADEVRREFSIRLKPQIAGYCTWYAEEPYGWGGDEKSTREFADLAQKLELKKWGLDFFQIDDYWQAGERELNGPAKDFTKVRPDGPYPSGMQAAFDNLAAHGIMPGIWYMPWSGERRGEWWKDKQDLFVKTADGKPYESVWCGTSLDMTNPKTIEYVKDVARRICKDWHCKYIKFDGMGTSMAYRHGAGGRSGMEPHDYGKQVFHDRTKTGVEAFRAGVAAMKEAAGDDVFFLGSNLNQSLLHMGPSYGLVDAMRVGGDNGPWERRWLLGVEPASTRYFFNGRVWYNDPDPVYVRDARAVGKARLMASWTSVAGFFYNFSDWLGNLSAERLDILKRTMAPHGILDVRPVDLFENPMPNIWHLSAKGYHVFSLCNWSEEEMAVDCGAAYAGLDPGKRYAAFDFWSNRFIGTVGERIAMPVPAIDCRVVALRECDGSRPVLVSTSRHVASPAFDVKEERWDAAARTLAGVSRTVPDEAYELRIWAPAGFVCSAVENGSFRQKGGELRVNLMPRGESCAWKVVFR